MASKSYKSAKKEGTVGIADGAFPFAGLFIVRFEARELLSYYHAKVSWS